MKKRLVLVMGLALGALTIGAAAVVLGTTPAVFTRATGENKTIVVNAADFNGSAGNFTRSGIEFHYEGASKVGDTVTLDGGRLYMTMAHYSGDSVEGGIRGNGFTAMAITGLNVEGSGHVVYAKPGTADGVTGTYSVAANIDLTHQNGGAEVTSANRTRIHLECGSAAISFTKITYTYECVEAIPTVVISGDASVNKDSTLTLTANTTDIPNSATYVWSSSDPDVASIVGNGKSATVTGVAGGDVTITVEALVGEVVVDSDTFGVHVIEQAATYYKVEVLSTTHWEGAGVFYMINPSSVSKTSSELGALTFSYEVTNLTANPLSFAMNSSHSYGHGGVAQDNNTAIYMNANAAPSNSDKFALRFEFKDAVNNIIYYSVAKFQGGSLIPDVQITGAESSVDIDDTLALTAVINDDDFTPVSYVWDTSDHSKATVVGNNLSATVTGVAAGSVDVTLTVTDSASNVLVGTFALTVTDPAHVTYLGWDKTHNSNDAHKGPLYFQGAGVIFAVNLSSIGHTRSSANAIIGQVTIQTTKQGASKDVFQQPGFADAEGLYVTFPDADFSSMTSVTIRMPNSESVSAVATMTLSWNAGVYTILTLNGQSFADYMAPQQGE